MSRGIRGMTPTFRKRIIKSIPDLIEEGEEFWRFSGAELELLMNKCFRAGYRKHRRITEKKRLG